MTASSRQESDLSHWTLKAPDGEYSIRIASGLVIGENEHGHFELAPGKDQDALVRFEVDSRTICIHLVSRHWGLASGDRMVGNSFRSERPVELHLPNNVFRIVGGRETTAAPERLELVRRYGVSWLRPTPLRADSRPTDRGTGPAIRSPRGRTEQDEQAFADKPEDPRTQLAGAPDRRGLSRFHAAFLGFAAGIGAALLYPVLRDDSTLPSPDDATSARDLTSAEREREPDPAPEPEPDPEPAPEVAPAIEPVALPPMTRRPIPEVAKTGDTAETVGGSEVTARPQAATAQAPTAQAPTAQAATADADREQRDEAFRARQAELALQRDLLAADRAMAQGRLTNPPEENAYALYNRVLAADPESKEASTGLQSVRQELVNRALAQLAGHALNDARTSLQAAANAGVEPRLIEDLREEIDYRERLINARAGRFETVYPSDRLVAINQEPPRVPRNYRGADVSVEVQFTITAEGDVRDVTVIDDAPDSLARELRRAVSEWRFEPVLDNGRPMPVRSSARFTFGS